MGRAWGTVLTLLGHHRPMSQNPEDLIPTQHTGVAKEVHQHVTAASEDDAAVIFNQAKDRLRSVNEWASISEGHSAKFLLCDHDGTALSRPAQQGDLVRIDVPAPHRQSNSGFDWVTLATVAEGADEGGNPWIVLTTRPTPDPTAPGADTAHFFDNGSTGTFLIRQHGVRVDGSHYGRNELPNTDGNLADKARALLVTVGAYLGLSDKQWEGLVKGLLQKS